MADGNLPEIRTDIDEANLVEEARIQSSQVRNVREVAAKAEYYYATAKDTLKTTTAAVRNEIRALPGNYGLVKVTNDAIEEVATVDPRVTAAAAEVNRAKYQLDMVIAVQEALVDRKKMISVMVDLILHDLHSSPNMRGSVPKGIKPRERDDE